MLQFRVRIAPFLLLLLPLVLYGLSCPTEAAQVRADDALVFPNGGAAGQGVRDAPDGRDAVDPGDPMADPSRRRGSAGTDSVDEAGRTEESGVKQCDLTWPEAGRYVGDCLAGMPHGLGTMAFPDGRRYSGQWGNGVPSGPGSLTYPEGRTFAGCILDGKPSGEGIMVFPDGRVYVATFPPCG